MARGTTWTDTVAAVLGLDSDPGEVISASARVVDEAAGSYPDRPVGAVCVIWRGTTTPGAAVAGDIYVNTGA